MLKVSEEKSERRIWRNEGKSKWQKNDGTREGRKQTKNRIDIIRKETRE